MNSASFDRVLRQVVIIPLSTLLLCIAALFYQMHTANEMLAAVHLADQRIRQTTELQSLITDEESGVRGYQITRDPAFLEPYSRAKAQLPDAFRRRRKASVLAGRAALIDDLQTAHDQWQQNFAESVIAGVQAGSQTSDVELNLEGKRQIDAIRQRIIHINTLTEQGRDVLNDRWRRQVRRTFVSAGVVAVLIGLFFGFYMRHLLKDVSVAFRQSHNVLRLRAEQAFRSEQRLRTTLQSIGDAVITCDPEGRIDSMNPVAEQLTGWAQQEAQDQPLEKVFQIVDETTREPLENPVSKVKRLNNVVGLKSHTLLLQKGGTEILIDNSGAPIRDKDGLMEGVVLVFRDVTMARRSQQALIANEKLAVAGRLAATIAHEIHNPLDSVSNLLFLMDGQSTEEESAQFLQMAKAEIARVTQISRAMLSLYRESRAPVAIDVKDTLESVLLLMERRFQTLGVTVTADLPENLLIFGFPAEMRQVFTNLLSNAAEAAGVLASVEVRARACVKRVDADGLHREAGVEVTIQDHGAGIPESVLDKLFQPFFTTKGEQGTGLGLWVSRGIVTKHGGSLELTSSTAEEDHGTRATVFLTSEAVTHSAGG